MNRYGVEIKPPVRKELEALPNNVLARVVGKELLIGAKCTNESTGAAAEFMKPAEA